MAPIDQYERTPRVWSFFPSEERLIRAALVHALEHHRRVIHETKTETTADRHAENTLTSLVHRFEHATGSL